MRARRAIIVSQKTRHIARLAQVLRQAKNAWLRMTSASLHQIVLQFDGGDGIDYDRNAGWSSLVARWAHNPKVGGSNPPPATKFTC